MNLQDPSEPISEGLRIPAADLLPPADIVSGVVDVVGLELHKDVALVIVAAGCFFLGVILNCMMPEVSPAHRRRSLLSAPMSFFLTSPLWFTLLSGDLIKTSIAPIDSFLAFAMGSGGVRAQMFAFGIVMVMGMLAAPILSFVTDIVKKLMGFFAQKAPGPSETN
ncbi:MAG: hypothetical protein ABJL99_06985 [Aliishimia sp.]